MVAQLMKTVPLASFNKESPRSEKMSRMERSSVTTVITTEAAEVTSARVFAGSTPSLRAAARAVGW